MNDDTAQQILTELILIGNYWNRNETRSRRRVARQRDQAAMRTFPQPSKLVWNPESVTVHFGKNKDVPLGKLSMRSVEWYAKEPEPKLDRNGKPFPPQQADVMLRNAARHMVHKARGTLAVTNAAPTAPAEPEPINLNDNEEVPF